MNRISICIKANKDLNHSSDEAIQTRFLIYADISKPGELPNLEMERIELFDDLLEHWTRFKDETENIQVYACRQKMHNYA